MYTGCFWRSLGWNTANVILNLLICMDGGEFLEQLSDCFSKTALLQDVRVAALCTLR